MDTHRIPIAETSPLHRPTTCSDVELTSRRAHSRLPRSAHSFSSAGTIKMSTLYRTIKNFIAIGPRVCLVPRRNCCRRRGLKMASSETFANAACVVGRSPDAGVYLTPSPCPRNRIQQRSRPHPHRKRNAGRRRTAFRTEGPEQQPPPETNPTH